MNSSVLKANLFALLLVLLQIIAPIFLRPLINILGYGNVLISDEYIFLLIPCILFIIINGNSLKKTLSLKKLKFIDIIIVIVIAILCQPIAGFLSELSSIFFKNPVANALEKLSGLSLGFMLFFMAVTPAICEESVTRGVILYGYRRKNIFTAAIVNGLIFGILHLSPQQFLYAFVLGTIFVYLVRITRSIFASMLCHFTFNSIQVVASRAYMSGISSQSKAVLQGGYNKGILLLYKFSIAAIFFMAVVMLIKYLHKLHKNDNYLNTAVEKYSEREYSSAESKKGIVVVEYSPLVILVIIYILLMLNRYL
ncbi:CPBP family intramembrane glutamic endopeptidase [Clostridium oryzae]|uniref:CAAX amino terminal protease self-immunity n=1 Tax=Clostridium oryzae TaxID=1450648 RepID=A0A1V4I6S1_9CLOT|nr:CPBP family intramembrane glutamic endopeptidase [Clostridium oryzae]OPJ55688.1 CAAX amino terminal protease self- immunity [Clostridium oryzae]